jgi:zinc protease
MSRTKLMLSLVLVLFLSTFTLIQAQNEIDIPFTKYVLKNGLTLIVHPDHKAPIVALNVWYHVGSKNENSAAPVLPIYLSI